MIVIGADESGTGAWAGPFTVCAVAVFEHHQQRLVDLGAKDSKSLSDKKRRSIMDALIDEVLVGKVEIGTAAGIHKLGKQAVWRVAMTNAILHVSKIVGRARIVVDGVRDPGLERALRVHGVAGLTFMPKADAKVPAVSAASIIAKTVRNDMMIALHEEYPEYNWKVNAGYGSEEHDVALKKYGKTIHHRPWKNLIDIPMRRS